jgi:5-methylcytosine-specific restriction endonuclease McrA
VKNRELYPENWEEIAFEVKEEAGWKCEYCGKQCRRPGEAFDTHRRTLTVSHKDHTPGNCERKNLQALCAPCHLRYDAKMHAAKARVTRAQKKTLDMVAKGQFVIQWSVITSPFDG